MAHDPQPYDSSEEGYLAFVIAQVRQQGAQPQPAAPRGNEQGSAGDA